MFKGEFEGILYADIDSIERNFFKTFFRGFFRLFSKIAKSDFKDDFQDNFSKLSKLTISDDS